MSRAVAAGDRFGRWTVVAELEPKRYPSGQRQRMALCRCDCGNEREVQLGHLVGGRSTQCTRCGRVERPGARRMPDGRPAVRVAAENGITREAFHARLRYGWAVERAATEPTRRWVARWSR